MNRMLQCAPPNVVPSPCRKLGWPRGFPNGNGVLDGVDLESKTVDLKVAPQTLESIMACCACPHEPQPESTYFESRWSFAMLILLQSFRIIELEWACSSAGRAPALQAGGQGFKSPHVHQPSARKSIT